MRRVVTILICALLPPSVSAAAETVAARNVVLNLLVTGTCFLPVFDPRPSCEPRSSIALCFSVAKISNSGDFTKTVINIARCDRANGSNRKTCQT